MIYLDLVIDSSGSACINMLDRYFDTFDTRISNEIMKSLVMKHSYLLEIEKLKGYLIMKLLLGQVNFSQAMRCLRKF